LKKDSHEKKREKEEAYSPTDRLSWGRRIPSKEKRTWGERPKKKRRAKPSRGLIFA